MIEINNVEVRNLQEQVQKNKDDIADIIKQSVVLDEFGIKVVGRFDTEAEMPTVEDYKDDNPDWEYGDAFAVGTEPPYTLFILTRGFGGGDDYFFNIGEFPLPGPQGPAGVNGQDGEDGAPGADGQAGVDGQRGSTWQSSSSDPSVTVDKLSGDQALNTTSGNVFQFNGSSWQLTGNIKGPAGDGNVASVNGKTGAVVLDADDIYATNAQSIQDNLERIDEEINRVEGEIPTATSDLTNDSGFLTSTDLSSYATTSYVNTQVATKSKVSVSGVGSSTNDVEYITVDGTEYHLAGGGGGGGGTLYIHSVSADIWKSKSGGEMYGTLLLHILSTSNTPFTSTTLINYLYSKFFGGLGYSATGYFQVSTGSQAIISVKGMSGAVGIYMAKPSSTGADFEGSVNVSSVSDTVIQA